MSASTNPTLTPRRCSATARLAARVDLPTPPLPLPTAMIVIVLFSAVIAMRTSLTPATASRPARNLSPSGWRSSTASPDTSSTTANSPLSSSNRNPDVRPSLSVAAAAVRRAMSVLWSVMSAADRHARINCHPFSRAPPVNRARRPYKSLMNDNIDGNIGRRSPRGLRQFFEAISLMVNSPWGSGPKGGDGDGSGDGKKPGPRNPWVTPDPIDINRGRKPRGHSALDELLRKGRGGFGGGGSGGGGQFDLGDSAKFW